MATEPTPSPTPTTITAEQAAQYQAALDTYNAKIASDEAAAKALRYQPIQNFVSSSQYKAIQAKASELQATLTNSADDRALYDSLNNVFSSLNNVPLVLGQRYTPAPAGSGTTTS